jgi:hypothetical protein
MPKPSLDTRQFAALLGIKESELVFALTRSGTLNGVPLPAPVDYPGWRTRRFRFDDVIRFKRKLEAAPPAARNALPRHNRSGLSGTVAKIGR